MNVIFLDMDGVMNGETFCKEFEGVWPVDPENVSRLNRIIEEVDDIIVVFSSSWRYAVKSKTIDINQLMRDQGYKGPDITERTICDDEWEVCGWAGGGVIRPRGQEIKRWLDEHPEAKRFVILDDDDDMDPVMDNLVQTSFTGGGLLDSHVDETIARLSK